MSTSEVSPTCDYCVAAITPAFTSPLFALVMFKFLSPRPKYYKSAISFTYLTTAFDITIEQCWDLFLTQNRKCAISGVDIQFSKKNPRYEQAIENTASLDRIDSSKGYTIDNVQWVHKEVNLMKMALPQDLFLKWCAIIATFQSSKSLPI